MALRAQFYLKTELDWSCKWQRKNKERKELLEENNLKA